MDWNLTLKLVAGAAGGALLAGLGYELLWIAPLTSRLATVKDGLISAMRHADRLEAANAKLHTELDISERRATAYKTAWESARDEASVLRMSLNQCVKNNTRDPKTGRFVKSKPTVVGFSDGAH